MFAMLGPLSNLLHHEIVILQRFAALVAEREREACAMVCDDEGAEWDIWRDGWHAANECAAAIRARGEKGGV